MLDAGSVTPLVAGWRAYDIPGELTLAQARRLLGDERLHGAGLQRLDLGGAGVEADDGHLGLGAGLAGVLSSREPGTAAVLVAAMLAYLAIAYAPRLKAQGDATSPVAAAATVGAAFLAGTGGVGLALAAVALVLVRLHEGGSGPKSVSA